MKRFSIPLVALLLAPCAFGQEGVYHIINADGSPGDYLSVHASGGNVLATVYRSAGPVNGPGFALADAGKNVATLYRWGSWDLYSGSLSGNGAALTGYAQYGLCKANVSLAFSGAGGTIKVAPSGPSEFAPAGAHPECSAAAQTLTMQQEVTPPASAAGDGVYQITNADGSAGDYVSVHSSGNSVIATVYRSADPSSSAGFTLTDGGEKTATLYKWGSWDLYGGALTAGSGTLTGYTQYGLCNASVAISLSGDAGTIKVTPTGPSEFAPAGAHPQCSAAGATLTMQKVFGGSGSGGGGSGGGGDGKSSGDCFNEADFHTGTVWDKTERTTSSASGVSESRSIWTTGGTTTYNGVSHVTLFNYRLIEGGDVTDVTFHRAYTGGNYINYDESPPQVSPVDMQPGQIDSWKSDHDPVTGLQMARTTTYVGREKITTALGSFDACRFDNVITSSGSGITLTTNETEWAAASGPYRGQTLKFTDVTKFTNAPVPIAEITATTEVISATYTPK